MINFFKTIMSNIEMEAKRKANKNIYKKHVEYQQSRVCIKFELYSIGDKSIFGQFLMTIIKCHKDG